MIRTHACLIKLVRCGVCSMAAGAAFAALQLRAHRPLGTGCKLLPPALCCALRPQLPAGPPLLYAIWTASTHSHTRPPSPSPYVDQFDPQQLFRFRLHPPRPLCPQMQSRNRTARQLNTKLLYSSTPSLTRTITRPPAPAAHRSWLRPTPACPTGPRSCSGPSCRAAPCRPVGLSGGALLVLGGWCKLLEMVQGDQPYCSGRQAIPSSPTHPPPTNPPPHTHTATPAPAHPAQPRAPQAHLFVVLAHAHIHGALEL